MDMARIGQFLSELRKEQNLTQAQLGEKIGVTNETVSRWETGTYLPPVESLQLLSELYHVSINEILSGERLSDTKYRDKAEENIKSALSESAFTLQEKITFFQRKWKKEHAFEMILEVIILLAFLVYGCIYDNGFQIPAIIGGFVLTIIQYNRMMAFVENYAYSGKNRADE